MVPYRGIRPAPPDPIPPEEETRPSAPGVDPLTDPAAGAADAPPMACITAAPPMIRLDAALMFATVLALLAAAFKVETLDAVMPSRLKASRLAACSDALMSTPGVPSSVAPPAAVATCRSASACSNFCRRAISASLADIFACCASALYWNACARPPWYEPYAAVARAAVKRISAPDIGHPLISARYSMAKSCSGSGSSWVKVMFCNRPQPVE